MRWTSATASVPPRPAAMCWRVRSHYPRSHSGLPRAPSYPSLPGVASARVRALSVPTTVRCQGSPRLGKNRERENPSSRTMRETNDASSEPSTKATPLLHHHGHAPLTSAETRRQHLLKLEAAHHDTSKSTESTEPFSAPVLPLQVRLVQKAYGVGKQRLVGRLALYRLTVLCVERVVAASRVASVKCSRQCEWIVGCGKWEVSGRCCRPGRRTTDVTLAPATCERTLRVQPWKLAVDIHEHHHTTATDRRTIVRIQNNLPTVANCGRSNNESPDNKFFFFFEKKKGKSKKRRVVQNGTILDTASVVMLLKNVHHHQ